MRKGSVILLMSIAMGCLNSCDGSGEELPPVPVSDGQPINWQIKSAEAEESKALVNSNDALSAACTPKSDNTHESIGVWGSYVLTDENGQSSTYTEFDAVPLTYAPKQEQTNPYNDWNYPGEARKWVDQAVYDFRACYPQKLMTSLMTQMDATMFQGGPVNTLELQEDILVAAIQVDRNNTNLVGPVPLDMQHIFSAIKFKVKAADGFSPIAGDGFTSCWLQNKTDATNLFSPSGYLIHSGNSQPEITWHTYESSSVPMYKWEHEEGVSYEIENTLYSPNGGKTGEEYTHNDAWILIVPQTVQEGTLTFNYTLKKAGNQVFSVNIPAITYEHGKQYTYMLEIRGSQATIKLTIKPWNHLDSSYDITV